MYVRLNNIISPKFIQKLTSDSSTHSTQNTVGMCEQSFFSSFSKLVLAGNP